MKYSLEAGYPGFEGKVIILDADEGIIYEPAGLDVMKIDRVGVTADGGEYLFIIGAWMKELVFSG